MFLPFLAMREVARLYSSPSAALHAHDEETMENFLFVCKSSSTTEEAQLDNNHWADAA